MFNISTIVVPTDFSKVSNSALEYAADLAEKMKASIHLVHVLDYNPPFNPGKSSLQSESNIIKSIEEEARKKLDLAAKQIGRESEISITKVLLKGRDYEEIIKYARSVDCNLIVIATHARTGVLLSLFGSVAENVIRYSHCPVLVIKPPQDANE